MSELLFGQSVERPQNAPRTVIALFDQGEWWKGVAGWIRVADMTPAHRTNSAALLLRDAASYADRVSCAELALMVGLKAPDEVVESWINEIGDRDDDPETWMKHTALYRALAGESS